MGAPVPVNSAARRGWSLLAVVAGATVPLLTACVGAPSAAPPPSPATTRVAPPATTAAPATTATTAPVPVDDEAQVRAVIDTYWQEWTVVGNPPDPTRTTYFELLTGTALAREQENLRNKAALGQARKLPDQSQFSHLTQRVSATGDHAIAIECVVDDAVVFNSADGQVLNNRVSTFQFESALVREGSRWLIADSRTVWDSQGVAQCPDA